MPVFLNCSSCKLEPWFVTDVHPAKDIGLLTVKNLRNAVVGTRKRLYLTFGWLQTQTIRPHLCWNSLNYRKLTSISQFNKSNQSFTMCIFFSCEASVLCQYPLVVRIQHTLSPCGTDGSLLKIFDQIFQKSCRIASIKRELLNEKIWPLIISKSMRNENSQFEIPLF